MVFFLISTLVLFPIVIGRVNSHYAIPLLVWSLIQILALAERSHDDWIELEYKQRQIMFLEMAATSVERFLPHQLPSGDSATDDWLSERAWQVASAVREKKKWILTPTKLTYNDFIDKIVSNLVCVTSGNWDALERVELKKPTHSQSWHSFVVSLLRAILVAALPIVGLWIFQQTPLALVDPVLGYVIAAVFIWVLLIFLAVLDQNFSSKITAFKDITNLASLLSPPGANHKTVE
jgi:hypothetical protein